MFGKTLGIDMAFRRKHGVLRIKIGCLNHDKIPRHFPMLFKAGFFTLTFVVEGEAPPADADVDMEGSDKGDDDDEEDDVGDDF